MIPDVSDLPYDEIIIHGLVYMRRYFLENTKRRSVRYHQILRSDADRDLHDHPWDFTTTILHGGYTETTRTGEHHYAEGDTLHRQAEDLHRLALDTSAWTHIVTGPVRRQWGFRTEQGWMSWRTYRDLHPHLDTQNLQ